MSKGNFLIKVFLLVFMFALSTSVSAQRYVLSGYVDQQGEHDPNTVAVSKAVNLSFYGNDCTVDRGGMKFTYVFDHTEGTNKVYFMITYNYMSGQRMKVYEEALIVAGDHSWINLMNRNIHGQMVYNCIYRIE